MCCAVCSGSGRKSEHTFVPFGIEWSNTTSKETSTMELELQKERLEGYRAAAPLLLTQEETAETVVPDYCPDVARIVSVSAQTRLRARAVADGKLTASGVIAVMTRAV